MNDKTRSPAANLATTPASLAPWGLLTEMSRWQMSLATENASAFFRAVESVRTVQQQMAHQTRAQYEAAAHKLQKACEPGDLLSIQSALLRFDFQAAIQYWQQLADSAVKAQVELMDGSKHLLAAPAEDPFKPMLQAWQNALNSPFNGALHTGTTH